MLLVLMSGKTGFSGSDAVDIAYKFIWNNMTVRPEPTATVALSLANKFT